MKGRLPLVVLVALLAAQSALVLTHIPSSRLTGDEPYYVAKARHLVEHGRFPKARPADLAAEAGAPGNSDWRPQGYPAFVALVSGGEFETVALRRRVTVAQLALVLVSIAVAWTLTGRTLVAAIVLGVSPWPFAFVTQILSDSLNACIAFIALALLYRWAISTASHNALLFAGALLSAATLLLRPEMAAIAPVPVAVALFLRWRRHSLKAAHVVAACVAMLLVVAVQFSYRTWFSGRVEPTLFGGLHIYNPGAFAWVNSWIGTEHDAYDFVYGLAQGDPEHPLPDRAFADDAERHAVETLRARTRAHGFSPEVDQGFAQLAAKRKNERPFGAIVLPRLWHTVHVWVNTETNEQLLAWLGNWPRPARRALIGALLLLKAGLLLLFVWRIIRRRASPLVMMMGSFVIARTLLVGLVLNWMVNRYLLVAWLPLLVVCLARDDEPR
jgi:hypothetical protein